MSISPIGGASPIQSQGIGNVPKPESGEAPGAPDHDSDSDNTTRKIPAATPSSPTVGHVNLKA